MKDITLNNLLDLFFLSYTAKRYNEVNHMLKEEYISFFESIENDLTYEMFLHKNIDLRDYSSEYITYSNLLINFIKRESKQDIIKKLDFDNINTVLKYLNAIMQNKHADRVFDETYSINDTEFEQIKEYFVNNKTYLSERWSLVIVPHEVAKYLNEDDAKRFNELSMILMGKRLTGSYDQGQHEMDVYFGFKEPE